MDHLKDRSFRGLFRGGRLCRHFQCLKGRFNARRPLRPFHGRHLRGLFMCIFKGLLYTYIKKIF